MAGSGNSTTAGDGALTIDELAERVGMTVRNLREWRTLGLLPRAEMRGRVGYYGPDVVDRIERIKKLRSEGFTLELIGRMLDAGGDAGDEVMRLADALRAPFRATEVPAVDPKEWAAGWGSADPAALRRAVELGMLREREDGRLEFTSARIAEIGAALGELGLSAQQILDATEEIRAHADGIADIFERVWLDHVWEPFVAAGMPKEELQAIAARLPEVQPLALDAVVAIFTVAMEAKIERSIARELERALAADQGR